RYSGGSARPSDLGFLRSTRVLATAFRASCPLRRIPAIVSFLNPQPALSLVGGNRSSCPNTDIRKECGVSAGGAAQVRMAGKSWSGKPRLYVSRWCRNNRRCAMSPLDVADNKVTDTQRVSSAYVPPLQRTEGQPPPVAAHGGLSYMAFDRDGDAGTAVALQDALAEI